MAELTKLVSSELGVPTKLIEDALQFAFIKYKKIRVPKRSGGFRTIVQPAAELKLTQCWLNARILSLLPISTAASAFHPGASILKNANIHKHARYSVRVDLSNFFASIQSTDLDRIIQASCPTLPPGVAMADLLSFIRRACFDRDDRLPIGYPTSPGIANAVMCDFDNALIQIISEKSIQFGRAQMTRYADDFVFSTDKPGACRLFVDTIRTLIFKTESPRLKINDAKTRYMSRLGGSTLVTGLRINKDGNVRVHATYRDHVRLLLKHFSNGKLTQEEHQKLLGHLAHIEHVDPMLFTRLSYRYFEEIARLRLQ